LTLVLSCFVRGKRWSENTLTSRDALEPHGPFGEMDLQAILSQQLRTNENLASWHKGRFRSDASVIEGEIDKVYVFLNALPSGKDRRYATNKLWMQRRTQRIGQRYITIKTRVDWDYRLLEPSG
jgi:hypothetical protein